MAIEVSNTVAPELVWIGSTHWPSDADISISRIKWTKEKGKAYSFVFRNEAPEKLGESLQIAINKNRVFFKASKEGYKAHTRENAKTQNAYMTVKETEQTKALMDFIGDYELKLDPYWEIYYIEKE